MPKGVSYEALLLAVGASGQQVLLGFDPGPAGLDGPPPAAEVHKIPLIAYGAVFRSDQTLNNLETAAASSRTRVPAPSKGLRQDLTKCHCGLLCHACSEY